MKMMQKIAILGFGREGQSVLKFIRTALEFRNAEVWILDKDRNAKIPKGARARLGKNYLSGLKKFDLIFRSPGIPYNLPPLVQARRNGARFSSLTELFFAYCPAKVIGITGTKGKGTTATLLYRMLKAAHRDAHLAGNIGTPALEILPKLKKNSVVILELSSFQLQGLKVSPPIAVVLDVFPDHLENIKTAEHGTHRSFTEYLSSKATIARFQKPGSRIFFFQNNPWSKRAASRGRGKKIGVHERGFGLFGRRDLTIPGYHNFKNAVMAAKVALALGVPRRTVVKTARKFAGNEHRLEFVQKIDGIAFYNDSASTNPQTSAAAVRAFPGSLRILVAGGKDKGLDYAPLAQAIRESRVKSVVLFGENKKKILRAIKPALKDFSIPVTLASGLPSAVRFAYRAARHTARSGAQRAKGTPIVIFSPGAASFDMFRNYADRGCEFKCLVKALSQ